MSDKETQLIKLHEGLRLTLYKDGKGYGTWGYGRNMETKGGTEQEASLFLKNDIAYIRDKLHTGLNFFDQLGDVRQAVLVDIAYNCGVHGLMGFVDLLHALSMENYSKAADEIIDSTIAPNRKQRIADMMRSGEWWTK